MTSLTRGVTAVTPDMEAANYPTQGDARPWMLEGLPPHEIQTPRYESAPSGARLHANELTEPWPEDVLAAVAEVVRRQLLNRYPDPAGRSLRRVIGQDYDVPAEQVVLGAGSLEIILLLARALTAASEAPRPTILVPDPTFAGYLDAARASGLSVVSIPLREDFHLDEPAMRMALNRRIGVCFLARPNNPTGTLWPAETIRKLIAAYPSTVFAVDEVYRSYANVPSLWDHSAPLNLVCISSLSKIGLAGVRLGYAIAHPQIAARLQSHQVPFSMSALTMAVGELFLTKFRDTHRRLVSRVLANRDCLIAILGRVPGAVIFPSAANHVLARLASPEEAHRLAEYLESRGILIHAFPYEHRLADCVRVTVGTSIELVLLERIVQSWLAEDRP